MVSNAGCLNSLKGSVGTKYIYRIAVLNLLGHWVVPALGHKFSFRRLTNHHLRSRSMLPVGFILHQGIIESISLEHTSLLGSGMVLAANLIRPTIRRRPSCRMYSTLDASALEETEPKIRRLRVAQPAFELALLIGFEAP